ncbi:hypothetical protein TMES_09220 [Thalassospira mesophila]|uniref:Solute-binding protein family 3/N-terminal domain-containing protein n=2 Tax=Thalassospira mesophila TaxID=1293891 RepID=A0A1Y2L100_9PROT|nr:hypothetical protein TMES_09220 [Thalassospira mesophila]
MLQAGFAVAVMLVGGGAVAPAHADHPIIMPVRSDDLAGVQKCYDDPQSSAFCDKCAGPNNYNPSLTNYVILRETLKAGGMPVRLVGIDSPNSARSRLMVETGVATVKADWDFNMDGNNQLLKSDPFIEAGLLFKGLYGLADNEALQKAADIGDVKDLSAVMNPNWRLDWQVLQAMEITDLYPVSTKSQMFRLVARHRADFTLLEFSPRPDLMQEYDGIKLVPVVGVKVAMPNAQHFMVSRKSPRAQEIVAALNRGLQILKQTGLISQCLAQGGLVNASTRDWQVLNTRDLDGNGQRLF